MFKISNNLATALLTVMHFSVDGLCALLIFSSLYSSDYYNTLNVFLIYNTLAFIFQIPIGFLIDKFNRPRLFLALSLLFLALAYLFFSNFILSAVLLGLCNSFFHISGGKQVINNTNNDISHLGIFVATGATGLVLGQRFFSLTLFIIFIVLLAISAAIVFLSKNNANSAHNNLTNETILNKKDAKLTFVLLFLTVFVVFIRAFIGKINVFNFTTTNLTFLLIAISTTLGKAVGGILAKRLNINLITIISMLASTLLLTLATQSLYAFLLGLFLFNFSMPITLYFAGELLKKYQATAFGILAGTLFIGYLFGMLNFSSSLKLMLIAILGVISMLLILVVNKKITQNNYALKNSTLKRVNNND
ncbi:MAG: MFS transporter [Clostridia bacterium]|nr:MFS transporter [Clostridia bacterium]